jgi:hypothetical protein
LPQQADPQRFSLSVAFGGVGSGTVRSIDGTLSCSAICSRSVPSGAVIQLIAAAVQGSHFVGWTGACSGVSECQVELSSDKTATATFDKDQIQPPTPARPPLPAPFLRVARSGAGKVMSDVQGIDCGQNCLASFLAAGPVTLTATADTGFSFTGWGGACSGTGTCVVAMTSETVVTAVFERLPPMPAACHGLMPQSLTAPVAVGFDEDLIEGMSDGTGENFLFTTAPAGVASFSPRAHHFVRIRDGVATETAVRQMDYHRAESQPEGFALFRNQEHNLIFDMYAPDGRLLKTGSSAPLRAGETSQRVDYAVAPSGGMAMMRWVWNASGSYTVHYGRFDAQGNVVLADIPLDLGGSFLANWGVDRTGKRAAHRSEGAGRIRHAPGVPTLARPDGRPADRLVRDRRNVDQKS